MIGEPARFPTERVGFRGEAAIMLPAPARARLVPGVISASRTPELSQPTRGTARAD